MLCALKIGAVRKIYSYDEKVLNKTQRLSIKTIYIYAKGNNTITAFFCKAYIECTIMIYNFG